jgi:ABC-type multidrug transport system fused ATPase/permease subunit
MFGLVFAIDFVMALALGVGLLSVAGYVILKSHYIAKQKSSEYAECLVKSEEQVLNLVTLYRELFVSKRLDYFDQNLKASRDLMEKNLTQSAMIPHFNKFVMEIGLVVCFVIFGLTGYLIGDSNEFMYKLVIFIAAGSRILPSLLRVQQGFVQISSHLGLSQSTIEILEEIKAEENSGKEGLGIANYVNLDPKENSIEIRDLDFKHGTGGFELKGVNLQIKRASKVAIVGSSGSGKTTLVDLILGIHSASSGEVLIGGYTNRDFQTLFPGKIGYVPQDSVVIDGSFLDNLLVKPEELPRISFFLDKLLSDVDLNEWIKSLPLELNTRIGTNGIELSGGQKQRIAIVRALINDPGILVLDEATSSLDSKTESVVSETIDSLNRAGKTIIMIAHRLRTVEKADQIVFVHNGKVENFYSWVDLKAKHPNFSLNHDPI